MISRKVATHRATSRRSIIFTILAAGAVAAIPHAALAQQPYPNRTITLVVAFAAGGVADSVGRLIGQKLGEQLGQTVVVENRAGAGGNIAAKFVAGANPDGYTLLVTTTALAINETLYKNKGFAAADFRADCDRRVEPGIAQHKSGEFR